MAQPTEFTEQVIFKNKTIFAVLPDANGVKLPKTVTTYDVANVNVGVLSNTGAVTITNLTSGRNYTPVKFIGDGYTTFKNNTNIKTSTGADKLLAANKAYNFTWIPSLSAWIEDAD